MIMIMMLMMLMIIIMIIITIICLSPIAWLVSLFLHSTGSRHFHLQENARPHQATQPLVLALLPEEQLSP